MSGFSFGPTILEHDFDALTHESKVRIRGNQLTRAASAELGYV